MEWVQPDPDPAGVDVQGVNQWKKELRLSLSLPFKQIYKTLKEREKNGNANFKENQAL